MNQRKITFISTCLLLLGLFLIPPPSASAACYGSACNGVNPSGSGCDSTAVTLARQEIYNSYGSNIGAVEIRWSPVCQTNWSRATAYGGARTMRPYIITATNQYYESYGTNTQMWSPMVYAPSLPARACAQIWWSSWFDSGYGFNCTIWR
jgi:hypothetical protein